jgi:predicted PurR-regulated permease PerM
MADSGNFAANFSPMQRRLITSALALIAFVVILGFLFGVFLLLRGFVSIFGGVLWPLAAAGILALILRPVVQWFNRRLKLGRIKSIALLYALVLLVMVGLVSFLAPVVFEQSVNFIERLPVLVENLRTAVNEKFPAVQEFLVRQVGEKRLESYQAALADQFSKLGEAALPAATEILEKFNALIALGTGLAIIPVYLFFFLKTDRDPTNDLKEQLSFIREDWRDDAIFLVREFATSMEAFFRGQILIGLIMGVLLAIGFSVVGVNFGIGLGLLIGALNIIPYFGTIIGLSTVLPIAYWQPDGGFGLLGMALGVFVLVQMIEGYVLTPRIMGEQTGLHPLTIIIAIFFWGTALNGILGMILAIPLTAFIVVAWRLVRRKYLDRLSDEDALPQANGGGS